MNQLDPSIKNLFLIAIIVLFLFVCFIILVVFIYNKKQVIQQQEAQLKESEFQNQLLQKELERQKAIQLERERISQDMHDDLGAGISAIKLQAEFLKYKISKEAYKEDIQAIITTSEDMNLAMREILWSLNSKNDTIGNFINYTSTYVERFLDKTPIQTLITSEITDEQTNLVVTARRNLFLVVKEAVHNVYKHSQAKTIQVHFKQIDKEFIIQIIDDGIGLSNAIKTGNGLTNMALRMKNIEGKFKILPASKGTHIEIKYELTV